MKYVQYISLYIFNLHIPTILVYIYGTKNDLLRSGI